MDLSTPANIFTGRLVFVGGSVSTVGLEDADAQASLGSLTLPAGIANGMVTLIFDNPLASFILPGQSVGYSFELTEGGNIVCAGTTFSVTGNGNNLSLTSENGNIDLLGDLGVAGTTTLEVDGFGATTPTIAATNPSNSFGTSLSLNPIQGRRPQSMSWQRRA